MKKEQLAMLKKQLQAKLSHAFEDDVLATEEYTFTGGPRKKLPC
jgi:hypothetical protein